MDGAPSGKRLTCKGSCIGSAMPQAHRDQLAPIMYELVLARGRFQVQFVAVRGPGCTSAALPFSAIKAAYATRGRISMRDRAQAMRTGRG